MTDQRFTHLIEGPLAGTLPSTRIRLLTAALRCVADASPEAESALEHFCQGLADGSQLVEAPR